ncbi:MAG: LCP family protein, partial [Acidimicrobiia bacterium]|nr:LCP family protein [Acidimicrobiia bacterium]
MIRRLVPLVALIAAATACSGGGAAVTTTTTPTTTTAATTTTSTTTTTLPVASVDVSGLDEELAEEISALYSWTIDRRNPLPEIPDGLQRHLASVDPQSGDLVIEATLTSSDLPDGHSVGVVTSGDDIVLVTRAPEEEWRVVGARLTLFEAGPWYGEDPRFLLVLGSDARPGQNQQRYRADSVHIVTVAGQTGTIVGFPRDSWVEGPDGNSKLTNVMAGRGPEVMLDTMLSVSGLPLEGYIVTGFAGFEGLIDDFGSVTIDLPSRVRSGIEGWADFSSGEQTLDGERALQLARIRKTLSNGDFGRSFNHGLLMGAALLQVQSMEVTDIPELLSVLLDHTWTDLSAADLLTLAVAAFELDSLEN